MSRYVMVAVWTRYLPVPLTISSTALWYFFKDRASPHETVNTSLLFACVTHILPNTHGIIEICKFTKNLASQYQRKLRKFRKPKSNHISQFILWYCIILWNYNTSFDKVWFGGYSKKYWKWQTLRLHHFEN